MSAHAQTIIESFFAEMCSAGTRIECKILFRDALTGNFDIVWPDFKLVAAGNRGFPGALDGRHKSVCPACQESHYQ